MSKDLIRKILKILHFDLTKNQQYDRATQKIMKRVISSNSNCIDVGCHKGEMLELMLKYAPKGHHFAFEPIPDYFQQLKQKYNGGCQIFQLALSDKQGETTFNFVRNAPAYSGIKKRKYAVHHPEIEELKVKLDTLDNLIGEKTKIDFIKIDVEGAEFDVLKGSEKLIKHSKPIIVFEFGLGASEFYGTKPEALFEFLENCGLKISLLNSWLKNEKPLDKSELKSIYEVNREYYFIAHPDR